jgi:hypothetical protein
MGLPKAARPIMPVPEIGEKTEVRPRTGTSDSAWSVLGGIGVVLALVGGVDLLLLWYPLGLGNPEWEFGTVTASLDGMPVLALGLALTLAAALRSRTRWASRGVAIAFGVLGVVLVGADLLYVTTLPMALRMAADPSVAIGLYRAVAKTAVQGLAYPVAFLWIASRGWR